MKTKLLFLSLVLLAAISIAQVTLEQSSRTVATERWLSEVQISISDNGSATFRGTIRKRVVVDGTNVVQEIPLRVLSLSGANLATALSNAGLPTEAQIVSRFRNLFHTAYTNAVGLP